MAKGIALELDRVRKTRKMQNPHPHFEPVLLREGDNVVLAHMRHSTAEVRFTVDGIRFVAIDRPTKSCVIKIRSSDRIVNVDDPDGTVWGVPGIAAQVGG